MLNEIIEYSQYSFDTESNHNDSDCRLQYCYLCRLDKRTENIHFSGLERAMISVARYHMFGNGKKDVELAKTMLQAWCGSESVPEEVKKSPIYNWLHKYIKNCLLAPRIDRLIGIISERGREVKPDDKLWMSDKMWMSLDAYEIIQQMQKTVSDKKLYELSNELQDITHDGWNTCYATYISPIVNCINALKKLPDKRKQFGHSMYEPSMNIKKSVKKKLNSENDYKMIRYDKILAEASNLGPLTQYFLLVDDASIINNLYNTPKEKDMLLKTVAAFLRLKSFDTQKFVAVNWTDILNWQNNTKDDDYRAWRNKLTINKKQIFTAETLQNQAKLSILQDFIQHFRLVEESEMDSTWIKFKEAHCKAVFYCDKGSSFHLGESKEYTKV